MDAVTSLSAVLVRDHPADAARVFERHSAATVAALLDQAEPPVIASALACALPVLASEYLVLLTVGRAAETLQLLPTEIALNLLRPLGVDSRAALLAALPRDHRLAYERLLAYPEGTAGAIMNPFAFVLPEDLTVEEAMRRVREVGRDRFYFPYVVDRGQKLVGLLTVRALMLARPSDTLSNVMHRNVVRLPATATSTHLERVPGWRAYQSLPVVDEAGVLLGAVPYDRLALLSSRSSQPDGAAAATDAFLELGAAYWSVLAPLAEQFTGLFGSLTRRRSAD